jgi:hypothetical protein
MARLDAESDEEKETKDIAGPQPDFTELMARELTASKLGFVTRCIQTARLYFPV